MNLSGVVRPNGMLRLRVVRGVPRERLTLSSMLYWSMPHLGVCKEVRWWRLRNALRILNQLWRLQLMKIASAISGHSFIYGALWIARIDGLTGQKTFYGLASLRVVTNVGRDEIVDEFDAATAADFDLTSLKFHGIGTGIVAEAATDTALGIELTTEYNPDNTRATGTQSQPTSDVYRTVGTNTLDSGTPAITEHGIFSQAATGGGTLLDRSVFAAINLNGANGDGLQTTYNLTIASGG